MDTTEVAAQLGTSPRTLRVFLRSAHSTFVAVGSGARYDFTEREIPILKKRFAEWQKAGKPRPAAAAKADPQPTKSKISAKEKRDRKVWSEEGAINLPDIRNPQVRRRVLADAAAAEERLMLRLIAVGQHITQLGDKK
jgi:hypothetical protein